MQLGVVFLLSIAVVTSAPADDPIHVDLPVYVDPQPEVEKNDMKKSSPLLDVFGNIGRTLFASKYNRVGGGNDAYLFSAPVSTLERAVMEREGLGSAKLTAKESLQILLARIVQKPAPLVDTIREEEKYGNTGDKFYSAGKAIVGGAEKVSNTVNEILMGPATILRVFTHLSSEKLNNFGGKLIGL